MALILLAISVSEFETREMIKVSLTYLLLFIIGLFFFLNKDKKPYLLFAIISSTLCGLFTIYSEITSPELYANEWYREELGYGNSNRLGLFLGISSMILTISMVKLKELKYKAGVLLLLISNCHVFYLTECRTSLLATLLSLAIFFLYTQSKNITIKKFILLIVSVFVLVFASIQGSAHLEKNRFTELLTFNPQKIYTLAQRIAIWDITIDIYNEGTIKEKLLGRGSGSYKDNHNKTLQKAEYRKYDYLYIQNIEHQHNIYLNLLYQYGLIGLLLFLFLALKSIFDGFREKLAIPTFLLIFILIHGIAEFALTSTVGSFAIFTSIAYINASLFLRQK